MTAPATLEEAATVAELYGYTVDREWHVGCALAKRDGIERFGIAHTNGSTGWTVERWSRFLREYVP